MIKNGIGGANTLSGLKFEFRVDLRTVLEGMGGFNIVDDDVFFNEVKVAQLFKKNNLYSKLLGPRGVDYKTIISKRLLPDEAIYVLKDRTLFILEMKFQEVAGSVDEKLQTCDFKNKQYAKLLKPLNIKVKYVYILNDWFKKPEYADVLKYVSDSGCYYFFNEIPLNFLGINN